MSEPRTLEVKVVCHMCRKEYTLLVPEPGYLAWRYGEKLIQDALPELSADQRELLISKTCGSCWNILFKGII